MTTSLVRAGDGGVGVGVRVRVRVGDGGQKDLFSTFVVNKIIKSNTNLFVEEEKRGLLGDCFSASCLKHRGDEKAVKDKEDASITRI
eukprot:CAMPEP_0170861208 /NCGR_PEP_ID=MMETSP0734-20130129/18041_1 /TAXON_ID=186038 /ORGANISM="Fragilariopsis kerguelensis, Strain L26-C5" /LENGTH=86 /DNA_ID=CAMNT_0011235173 /DNA_START=219 /DNA_END=480 /DNA_ORIENTATION=+